MPKRTGDVLKMSHSEKKMKTKRKIRMTRIKKTKDVDPYGSFRTQWLPRVACSRAGAPSHNTHPNRRKASAAWGLRGKRNSRMKTKIVKKNCRSAEKESMSESNFQSIDQSIKQSNDRPIQRNHENPQSSNRPNHHLPLSPLKFPIKIWLK